MGTLITPDELRELVDSGAPPKVLDVRWRLDRPDGYEDYLAAHIPGAVYVDLDRELAEPGQTATAGRHPLPSTETLQQAARRWGLHPGDTVVVYDDIKSTSATRAWWLLRHGGVEDVRVLDGSLRGWTDAGHPTESGEVTPTPGTVTLDLSGLPALGIEEVEAFTEYGTLLDVRAYNRYTGEHEPYDPRAGHIPGAINAPTPQNVDEQGRFLDPQLLRERFLALGVDPEKPVASYCGSGIHGTHNSLALELAGFETVLYPGSFSEWSNNPERPVATGDQP